jgi:hypothetical protein
MSDPTPRPGNDDPAIEHATDEVVASWQDATPGKDPDASPDDFARMREGMGDAASGDTDLAEAARRGTEAGGEDPSAG